MILLYDMHSKNPQHLFEWFFDNARLAPVLVDARRTRASRYDRRWNIRNLRRLFRHDYIHMPRLVDEDVTSGVQEEFNALLEKHTPVIIYPFRTDVQESARRLMMMANYETVEVLHIEEDSLYPHIAQDEHRFFTTRQAAEYLGVTIHTIRWHLNQTGRLKHRGKKIDGRTWLFSKAALDDFREERRREAKSNGDKKPYE